MKRPGFYLILFGLSILSSCSNDSADQESSTTNSASSSVNSAPTTIASASAPTTLASVAKVKKPDAVVQGIKGKVEVMSETTSFPGNPKRVTSKNVFKYNKNGDRIELSTYRAGKLSSTIKATYDANGIITGEKTFLADGKLDVNSAIKTDAKGNIIEQNDTRPVDNALFNYKYLFRYDEKGQQIERIAYKGNGTLSFRYQFKYDDKGNRIEWIQYGPSNAIVGRVIYKYDANNNLIAEDHFDSNGVLKAAYVVSREFDKKNNWILQKKMQNDTAVEIKEREIKYH